MKSEITTNHGKLDLIINDAKHGVKVWKMLDIWKDAITDNGIIITEEISCATREQIPNGDLINEDKVLSNNTIKIVTLDDVNLDFDDIPPEDRGTRD